MKNPVIATKFGKVKGKVGTDYLGGKYYSFQGIPYAKAPIGNLRFKAPQKLEPWTEEFNATKEGPSCPSSHIFFMTYTGKEDNCLNLNVYIKQVRKMILPLLLPLIDSFCGMYAYIAFSGNCRVLLENNNE
ncbi:hypothetical protein WA026_007846 [Henosepilachna vigintioctopunctata]